MKVSTSSATRGSTGAVALKSRYVGRPVEAESVALSVGSATVMPRSLALGTDESSEAKQCIVWMSRSKHGKTRAMTEKGKGEAAPTIPGAFEYVFPAIRGVQAGREYYVTMCPLRLIPRLFLFNE